MKKNLLKQFLGMSVFMALLFLLMGCQKEPVNRDIEGHWSLERFTKLEGQETVECERIYWAVTRVGVQCFEKQGPHGYFSLQARLEYRENETSLVVKDVVVTNTNELATLEEMYPYGLNNSAETVFQVVRSSHKNLVLESGYARLEFRRF